MEIDLYDYENYQDYLVDALALKNKATGSRADLARYLSCQTSFISQICTKRTHFSLEHALSASKFFKHTKLEERLFMLLVQKERAGSVSLSSHFQDLIESLKKDRQVIKEKIQIESKINPQDQALYYSYWWYSAVHIATSLPTLNTPAELSSFLNVPIQKVKEILNFLVRCGLVVQEADKKGYSIGENRIHLSTDSPLLLSHHKNWRVQALKRLDRAEGDDLHFSGVLGISKTDAQKIKKMIVEILKEAEPLIRDSAEDSVYTYLIDFYKM